MYQNNHQFYPIFDDYITGSDTMSESLKNDGGINGVPADPINDIMGGVTYKYHYTSADGRDYLIEYYLETDSTQGHSAGLNTSWP